MTRTVLVLSFPNGDADANAARLVQLRLEHGSGCRGDPRVETARIERTADLIKALVEHDPAIVHFAGQGGELTVDGQTIPPDELGGFFAKAKADPECVLLNAYYTLERADAPLEHVHCVVGTPGGDQKAAMHFWGGFYYAIGRGEAPAAAFERGRVAVVALGLGVEQTPRFASRDPNVFDAKWDRL